MFEGLRIAVSSATRAFNLDAGMFAFKVACSCQEYCSMVEACIVEGQEDKFLGEPVRSAHTRAVAQGTRAGLTVRPWSPDALTPWLAADGYAAIQWHDEPGNQTAV